jgi:hypothetical protein
MDVTAYNEPEVLDEPVMEEEYAELFDFEKAKKRIKDLISDRSGNCSDAEARRKERYVDLNVDALRESNKILEDGSLIPVRIIDSNIMQELPDSMAFLNANNRLAIFHPVNNPDIKPRILEYEFTKVCTYAGWSREFMRTFDGSKLHGWDALEVVFDASKPGHVAFEHVGYDNLFFNVKAPDLQDSEIVLRRYNITMMRLWGFIGQYGFNQEQVYKVCPKDNKLKRDKTVCIYKYYFKYQDIVYVGWLATEGDCSDWLKAPEELKLGIYTESTDPFTGETTNAESNIDQYPIFIRIHKDDEQELIDQKKGRGFLDGPQQEATTAITTSYVDGTVRASNIFGSPKADDPDTSEMKLLDMKLVPGGIYSRAMEFWSMPYPDASMMTGLAYLGTLNSSQNGKLATAVSNRKDSRKTAEELEQAGEKEDEISGISQLADSEFLRGVFAFTWLIVQSQALQNKIAFCRIPAPVDPNMGMPMMPQAAYVNDVELIGEVYDIRPAGDTDVVEAEKEKLNMRQDWPVMQTFPGLKEAFIEEYIRLSYPKKADAYIAAMKQGNVAAQIIQSLSQLLMAFAQPEEVASLAPEQQQKLQQLGVMVQQYLASQSAPQPGQPGETGSNKQGPQPV